VSRVTNTQADNKGWRQAGSIGGTASVAVTFAQFTSLLELAVPSLELLFFLGFVIYY
jgi:hypothetical protein